MSVRLNILLDILNWILNEIFSPIFEFIGKLLESTIGYAINTVFAPLFIEIMKPILNWLVDLIMLLFGDAFYFILRSLLQLLEVAQEGFDILIGLKNPHIKVMNPIGEKVWDNQTSLIDYILFDSAVSNVVWAVMLLGFILALAFSTFAVMRSMGDLDQKRPLSAVLKSAFRSFFNVLFIPLFVFVVLKLSGTVLQAVSESLLEPGGDMATTVFLVSGLNAAQNDRYNTPMVKGNTVIPSFTDPLRKAYYTGAKDFKDYEQVKRDFKLSEMDYFVGWSAAAGLLIVMCASLLFCVSRIIEMAVLYIVSPLFAAVTPLDDGAMLKKWREMFIGRAFMGIGTLVGMRVYLMLLPVLMSVDPRNRIDFTGGGYISTEMEYVLKVLIAIGGAFAIFKAGGMITSLISAEAGAKQSLLMSTGYEMTKKAASMVKSAAGSAAGAVGSQLPSVSAGIKRDHDGKLKMHASAGWSVGIGGNRFGGSVGVSKKEGSGAQYEGGYGGSLGGSSGLSYQKSFEGDVGGQGTYSTSFKAGSDGGLGFHRDTKGVMEKDGREREVTTKDSYKVLGIGEKSTEKNANGSIIESKNFHLGGISAGTQKKTTRDGTTEERTHAGLGQSLSMDSHKVTFADGSVNQTDSARLGGLRSETVKNARTDGTTEEKSDTSIGSLRKETEKITDKHGVSEQRERYSLGDFKTEPKVTTKKEYPNQYHIPGL